MNDKNTGESINKQAQEVEVGGAKADEIPSYRLGDEAEQIDKSLDARGLTCPMPLLKAKLALNTLNDGQCLEVFATDKGSVRDFHAYAKLSGQKILSFEDLDGEYRYLIRKVG